MTDTWKSAATNNLERMGYGILDSEYIPIWSRGVKASLATKFHERMPKGAALREYQDVEFHLAYWETPYYKSVLDQFLSDSSIDHDKIAIDIGCGDGRFTQYLLMEKGFTKVIATDSHLLPLKSLARFAEDNGLAEKLIIIHCSADSIPVASSSINLAMAIGVFYYLNDRFEDCLCEAHRILEDKAVLINSEPDLEGAVYKSMIFEGMGDAIENLVQKIFKEEKGETNYKFRLFEREELKSILSQHGFTVVASHGLSLLPSILRIKMVRGEFSNQEIREKEGQLMQLFDYFNKKGNLFKHIIWKSKKTLKYDE